MKKTIKQGMLLGILLTVSMSLYSINPVKELVFTHKIVAGFNFGASTPLPIPDEIEKIKGWWPQFAPQLGYNIKCNPHPKWGLGSGILLNFKGMGTKSEVKYLYTQVVMEKDKDTKLRGYFSGNNKMEVKTAYVTVPLYATYNFNEKWQVRLGGYASYLFSGEFTGTVSDGYLRVETPTGEKVEIEEATFDFGDDIRTFDLGLTMGGEYNINHRFGVYANLDWALTPLFPSDFNLMAFKLRNIYVGVGLTYKL